MPGSTVVWTSTPDKPSQIYTPSIPSQQQSSSSSSSANTSSSPSHPHPHPHPPTAPVCIPPAGSMPSYAVDLSVVSYSFPFQPLLPTDYESPPPTPLAQRANIPIVSNPVVLRHPSLLTPHTMNTGGSNANRAAHGRHTLSTSHSLATSLLSSSSSICMTGSTPLSPLSNPSTTSASLPASSSPSSSSSSPAVSSAAASPPSSTDHHHHHPPHQSLVHPKLAAVAASHAAAGYPAALTAAADLKGFLTAVAGVALLPSTSSTSNSSSGGKRQAHAADAAVQTDQQLYTGYKKGKGEGELYQERLFSKEDAIELLERSKSETSPPVRRESPMNLPYLPQLATPGNIVASLSEAYASALYNAALDDAELGAVKASLRAFPPDSERTWNKVVKAKKLTRMRERQKLAAAARRSAAASANGVEADAVTATTAAGAAAAAGDGAGAGGGLVGDVVTVSKESADDIIAQASVAWQGVPPAYVTATATALSSSNDTADTSTKAGTDNATTFNEVVVPTSQQRIASSLRGTAPTFLPPNARRDPRSLDMPFPLSSAQAMAQRAIVEYRAAGNAFIRNTLSRQVVGPMPAQLSALFAIHRQLEQIYTMAETDRFLSKAFSVNLSARTDRRNLYAALITALGAGGKGGSPGRGGVSTYGVTEQGRRTRNFAHTNRSRVVAEGKWVAVKHDQLRSPVHIHHSVLTLFKILVDLNQIGLLREIVPLFRRMCLTGATFTDYVDVKASMSAGATPRAAHVVQGYGYYNK